ncbi:hypothetical protein TW80_14365 [Loktanella sp. S4079]|nr:hypothetical protein TW80_14365 [Loktanella sp. S4079]
MLLALAFMAGIASAALWLNATHRWHAHLQSARFAGETLYDAITLGAEMPPGITQAPLPAYAQAVAQRGRFERLTNVPRPAMVTHLTLNADHADLLSGKSLRLAIVSSALRYPVSEIALSDTHSTKNTMGEITVLLATYCSDAMLFASIAGEDWQLFEGQGLWGCAASPADTRLGAVMLGLLALAILAGITTNAATDFSTFAGKLRSHRRLGQADMFTPVGPAELRDLIDAVNAYRIVEREHLAERALVLSGVSHDLGTPATRLKLRAALIADPELRGKFEADIDQMTGIIESVLTYTRAELSTEDARKLSLTSLVDAVVSDYEDIGKPVGFGATTKVVVEGGQSIFMSRRGRTEMTEESQIILQARPVALRRALTNLIDNALKYGRRAVVAIETDAEYAHILIEDEGGQDTILELQNMTAPFKRGANSASIEGFGMGLTIASTIAIEHGGSLSFEPGKMGLVARLSIARH